MCTALKIYYSAGTGFRLNKPIRPLNNPETGASTQLIKLLMMPNPWLSQIKTGLIFLKKGM